ncbi:MAG: GNAT family N-acetyltransferase [Actinomycetota bacterium]|nr:GNAT family N-acetyltransferase [Actinomycetota bacterium]
MTLRVEQVLAGVTLPLRQQVLRPHQRVVELMDPSDDHPESGHFAAYDGSGAVVGTASVRRAPPPWEPADTSAWQLRGMATADGLRGQGVGAAVLERAVAHVASLGGGVLWCNARLAALSFYERAGFVRRGEEWVDPQIGPHVVMWRTV